MKRISQILLAAAFLLAASPVWAAAEEGESSLFAGDLGNVVWTLITFALVLFVLSKFAWTPILSNLQQREDFIRDSLTQAKADRDAAAAKLAEYEGIIAKARAEATGLVEEGRRDAEVMRARVEAEARAERDAELARAKREISIAKQTAVQELYTVSGRLATDIASRIVGKELQPADHQRLIDDSIAEIGQLESN